jgi:hypothetical protein
MLNRAPTLHRLGHPGVRADSDRGQGHSAASAGVHGLQRRLRRRPDGGARSAVRRSADRGAGADAVQQQHPVSRQRQPHHRPQPGYRFGHLLHDPGENRCRGKACRSFSPEEVRVAYDAGMSICTPMISCVSERSAWIPRSGAFCCGRSFPRTTSCSCAIFGGRRRSRRLGGARRPEQGNGDFEALWKIRRRRQGGQKASGLFRRDEFASGFRPSAKERRGCFRLDAGDHSGIISDGTAFNIFQVVERGPEIPFEMSTRSWTKRPCGTGRLRLPESRAKGHGHPLRPPQRRRLPLFHRGRAFHFHRRHDHSQTPSGTSSSRRKAGSPKSKSSTPKG